MIKCGFCQILTVNSAAMVETSDKDASFLCGNCHFFNRFDNGQLTILSGYIGKYKISYFASNFTIIDTNAHKEIFRSEFLPSFKTGTIVDIEKLIKLHCFS